MTITSTFILPGTQQARPTTDIAYFEERPDDFIMEPKYDGFRMLARFYGTRLPEWQGYSRAHKIVGKGEGMSRMLPHIHRQLSEGFLANGHTVLDGELYVDDSKGGYHAKHHATVASVMKSLSGRARSLQGVDSEGNLDQFGLGTPLTYFAFDILFHDGEDLRALPWHSRRATLENFVGDWMPHVRLSPTRPPSQDALDVLLARGVEGCIIKNRRAPYVSWERPKNNWWKYKVDQTSDVVCMGFTNGRHGKGVRNMTDTIGAIVFGQYQVTDEGLALVERGRTSGMDDSIRWGILSKEKGIDRRSEMLHRVFEIRHNGIQNPGFRHPRFLWWRDDKREEDCTWD